MSKYQNNPYYYFDLLSKEQLLQIILYLNNTELKNMYKILPNFFNDNWIHVFAFKYRLINFNESFIDINFNNKNINYYLFKNDHPYRDDHFRQNYLIKR